MTAKPGRVYWLTGLAGAGKTTIGFELADQLRHGKPNVVHLDGDHLRMIFDAADAFHPDERRRLAFQYIKLCRTIAEQGIDVVCTTISMFPEVQAWGRENIPGYFQVYVRVTMDTLFARDQKQLYSRAKRGEIDHVMGVDIPIEEPVNSDLVLDNNGHQSPKQQAALIMMRADGVKHGGP